MALEGARPRVSSGRGTGPAPDTGTPVRGAMGGAGRAAEARANALFELALAVTGAGLALFMVAHEALHFTVLIGAPVYDSVAAFMERYYLLQAVLPPLIIGLLVHVALALRKVPTSYREQRALVRHMRSIRHFDTWSWLAQMATGLGLVALVSIHVWVVVSDLPIEAAKSGERVFGAYLWNYVPFVVLVQMHMSIGMYRIAVKWWPVSRGWAHGVATAWLVLAVGLGMAILVALYRLGGAQ